MKTTAYLGLVCALFLMGSRSQAGDQLLWSEIQQSHVFTTPPEWLGEQAPPADESRALLLALQACADSDPGARADALENFLSLHPGSPWAPSLHLNLAERYVRVGARSAALAHWAAAWNATKNDKSRKAQAMAACSFASWADSLLCQGQTKQLAALCHEIDQIQLPLGSYGAEVAQTRAKLERIVAYAERYQSCGLAALVTFASLRIWLCKPG